MTELIILGRIIWNWRSSLTSAKKHLHHIAYYFLISSEVWIFLNLILALLISIPAVNLFTHGTHITVAHSMGSTIGINTMILFASVFFILHENSLLYRKTKWVKIGCWLANLSLLIFWCSLIGAGYKKAVLSSNSDLTFQEIMKQLSTYLISFAGAGIGLLIGMVIIIWIALSHFITLKKRDLRIP